MNPHAFGDRSFAEQDPRKDISSNENTHVVRTAIVKFKNIVRLKETSFLASLIELIPFDKSQRCKKTSSNVLSPSENECDETFPFVPQRMTNGWPLERFRDHSVLPSSNTSL
ncbi:hypothetical protein V1477_016365 [Vespula maculifrons]|uniref:Uncharacterized protein n=1 Tax=Vespula maculifrons TaxID=7453 RepID=A0ABD2BCT2_VESMC